jgi:hypothetical protein
MNLKYIMVGIISLLVLQTEAFALPDSSAPPGMMGMSAKFAKARAQIRAYRLDDSTSKNTDPYAMFSTGTSGCDVNVANVALNGASSPPNDVIVFVQGDIIQANNNCR